jgi:uncharacterized repeat protein (TIGR01451 family)
LVPGISAASGAKAVVAGTPVLIGTQIAYALVVTNNGPNEALNVVGVLNQSMAGSSTNVFTNDFGNMEADTNAIVLFTNTIQAAGPLTNTWTVTTVSTNLDSASNSVPLVITVIPPEPVMVANGVRLLSESSSAPNGAINSNEIVVVAFTLENIGAASSTNLTATLLTTNGVFPTSNGVTVSTEKLTYGAISPGASGTENYQFMGSGSPGSTITAVLALQDSAFPGDTLLGMISNSFVIPTNAAFANSAYISIPEIGAATPYPSSILVSVPASQLVSKVTATLQGFTHTFPHDVNVVLESPSGQQTLLMAHCGGPFSVSDLVLGFDEAARTTLPSTQMVSSTNLPTQDGAFDVLPGILGTPNNTNLAIFNGSNPNGLWSLYIYDDTAGNDGYVANGWTLDLTLVNPVNPPGTLAVGMTSAPNPVIVSNFLTYNIVVTNLGLSAASNVVLTETLPAGASLVSAAASQGAVNTSVPGFVTYNLGTIANTGAAAYATNVLQPILSGTLLSSATATNAANLSGATASNSVSVVNLANFELTATTLTNRVRLTLATFAGQTGENYVIQVSTNLVNWTNLSTNMAVGVGEFTITNNISHGSAQFYRAEHFPQ